MIGEGATVRTNIPSEMCANPAKRKLKMNSNVPEQAGGDVRHRRMQADTDKTKFLGEGGRHIVFGIDCTIVNKPQVGDGGSKGMGTLGESVAVRVNTVYLDIVASYMFQALLELLEVMSKRPPRDAPHINFENISNYKGLFEHIYAKVKWTQMEGVSSIAHGEHATGETGIGSMLDTHEGHCLSDGGVTAREVQYSNGMNKVIQAMSSGDSGKYQALSVLPLELCRIDLSTVITALESHVDSLTKNKNKVMAIVSLYHDIRMLSKSMNNSLFIVQIQETFIECSICEDLSVSDDSTVLSVELKPKWLFKAKTPAHAHADRKKVEDKVCRFCLHRIYKQGTVLKGSVEDRIRQSHCNSGEGYCPMRMVNEMTTKESRKGMFQHLVENEKDHNNLKILYSIIDGDSQNGSAISNLLATVTSKEDTLGMTLQQLGTAQEHLHELFPEMETTSQAIALKYIEESNEYPHDPISVLTEHFISNVVDRDVDLEEAIQVSGFIASASLKDCSMIIRFSTGCSADYGHVEKRSSKSTTCGRCNQPVIKTMLSLKGASDNNGAYSLHYDIKLIDVDLKPISKLERYATFPTELVNWFLKSEEHAPLK